MLCNISINQIQNINYYLKHNMKLHILNTAFSKHRSAKVRAVAKQTHQEIVQVVFDEKSNIAKTASFPILPILETAEGLISTSNAIVRYLANVKGALYGKNLHEKALVDQWLDIISYDFEAAVYGILVASTGAQVEIQKITQDIAKFLSFLEHHLHGKKTHLVGTHLTIADISLLSNLVTVYHHFLSEEERNIYQNLTHYFNVHAAHFGSIFGEGPLPTHSHSKFASKKIQYKPVVATQQKEAPKLVETPKPADDDIDLFGDSSEIPKAPEPPKEVKKPQVKKKKKEVVAKSIVMFDVKVYEQEEDLQKLAQKIYAQVNMDGLIWNREHKILPVAYTMKKLQMGCVIEDAKVNTDDIFDLILAWEDIVQSVDTVAFQKV